MPEIEKERYVLRASGFDEAKPIFSPHAGASNARVWTGRGIGTPVGWGMRFGDVNRTIENLANRGPDCVPRDAGQGQLRHRR